MGIVQLVIKRWQAFFGTVQVVNNLSFAVCKRKIHVKPPKIPVSLLDNDICSSFDWGKFQLQFGLPDCASGWELAAPEILFQQMRD